MTIKVTYTPPPKAEGTVTLEISESLAQKLRALLRHCNSGAFDALSTQLSGELPDQGFLGMKGQPTFDLYGHPFIPE